MRVTPHDNLKIAEACEAYLRAYLHVQPDDTQLALCRDELMRVTLQSFGNVCIHFNPKEEHNERPTFTIRGPHGKAP